MYTIKADFRRIEDVSLREVYDEVGVYVLWNAHATVRPSYIGEGNLLRRFVDHLDKTWAQRPLGGLLWIADIDDYASEKERKLAAQAVEDGLLRVAGETNRWPPNNRQEGRAAARAKLLRQYGSGATLRISVGGFDPLAPPERARMAERKVIAVRDDDFEFVGWRSV